MGNPRDGSGHSYQRCIVCGRSYRIFRCRLLAGRRFCSQPCFWQCWATFRRALANATGRHSGTASLPGGHRSECAGDAPTVAVKRRVVSVSTRSQKHCRTCGELLSSSSGRYCSRTCRMLMAAFEEFSTFHFIMINSRWAGAPTQEQALKEYLLQRMQEAVRRLSKSADDQRRTNRA